MCHYSETRPPSCTPWILRPQDLAPLLKVSVSTVWRRAKTGALPKPWRIGGPGTYAKGWLVVDVRQAVLGVNSLPDCNAAQAQGSVPWVLRPQDLAARLGVSLSTVHRWARNGALPPPRRLGGGTKGWPTDEAWQALLRIKASDGEDTQ